MSPIIYARHRCAPAEDPDVAAMGRDEAEGVMWQCPECDAYWETEVTKGINGQVLSFAWACTGRPSEQAQLREVEAALEGAATATASTPTVTPHMVQLAVDTYEDHMCVFPNDGAAPLGWCGECETGIYEPHTIQAHAREKAAEALQAALAAGETR